MMCYLETLYKTFETNRFDAELQALDEACQTLRQRLGPEDAAALSALIDGHLLLREQTALAAFGDGLRLALGLAGELRLRSGEDEIP